YRTAAGPECFAGLWCNLIFPYTRNAGVYKCPSMYDRSYVKGCQNVDYAWNIGTNAPNALNGTSSLKDGMGRFPPPLTLTDVPTPADTILIGHPSASDSSPYL